MKSVEGLRLCIVRKESQEVSNIISFEHCSASIAWPTLKNLVPKVLGYCALISLKFKMLPVAETYIEIKVQGANHQVQHPNQHYTRTLDISIRGWGLVVLKRKMCQTHFFPNATKRYVREKVCTSFWYGLFLLITVSIMQHHE